MTLDDVIKKTIDNADVRIQNIYDCVLSVWLVKRTKGQPAHSRVQFATTNMTPNDLARRPNKIGLIVWIPTDLYEKTIAESKAEGKVETVETVETDEVKP